MRIYQTNEARFFVPDEYVDRSMTAFIVPRSGSGDPGEPGEFSFVMTREEVSPGIDIAAYADEQMIGLAQALEGFRQLRREKTTLDDQPAEQAEFTWVSEGQMMRQHQTYVQVRNTVLTITATALAEVFPRHEGTLMRLIRGMQIGR